MQKDNAATNDGVKSSAWFVCLGLTFWLQFQIPKTLCLDNNSFEYLC